MWKSCFVLVMKKSIDHLLKKHEHFKFIAVYQWQNENNSF
jgi:hypothetical protein